MKPLRLSSQDAAPARGIFGCHGAAPWMLAAALILHGSPLHADDPLHAGAGSAPTPVSRGSASTPQGVRLADGSALDEGELAQDMAQLARHWTPSGRVTRAPARLLHRGEQRQVLLPPGVLESPDGCVTVAVLGARNVSFLLLSGPDASNRRVWPLVSRAGLAEVTRCGRRKASLSELAVQMRSPRGVLESFVSVTREPLRPARELLTTRQTGPAQPPPAIGPRPRLAPASERAARLERAARRAGATRVIRTAVVSDGSGRGTLPIRLDAGCHRLDVLADGDANGGADVDARLVDLHQDEPLVEDASESGQATIDACVARDTRVLLSYTGTPSRSDVTVSVASWSLPAALPETWGPLARERLARALGREVLGSLRTGPVQTSLGVQGATRLPVELEPGACYTVAAATLRGAVTSFALGVRSGAVRRENHARDGAAGIALSLCAEGDGRAQLEVHTTGVGIAWVLGVWQTAPAPGTSEARDG